MLKLVKIFALLCVALFACASVGECGVVSVDVTPEARQLAEAEGWSEVWITNVYHSCPKGANLALVRGDPKSTEGEWIDIDADGLIVHVPANKVYRDNTPRVIVRKFSFDNKNHLWVGNEEGSPDENARCN